MRLAKGDYIANNIRRTGHYLTLARHLSLPPLGTYIAITYLHITDFVHSLVRLRRVLVLTIDNLGR